MLGGSRTHEVTFGRSKADNAKDGTLGREILFQTVPLSALKTQNITIWNIFLRKQKKTLAIYNKMLYKHYYQ